MSPDWSPDRKKIAYVSFENGLAEIFIQDLKSGDRDSKLFENIIKSGSIVLTPK